MARVQRPRRLTSVDNAAHYADVSSRTIRRYIADGRLTGYRVGPRLIKVDLDELDRIARPIPTAGRPQSLPGIAVVDGNPVDDGGGADAA
ncbi:MAG: hypothetical protein GEV03_13550 [Streptosporangiales bacterium]|nr:hypothetical protein [Streptosporangiales bacterium]